MKRVLFSLSLFLLFIPLFAQNQPVYASLDADEQLSFVGMMMADLLERFGPPRSVISERGGEPWQDDVVFQYNGADFYIYRDRIWQVKFASTHGISNGDKKAAALLILGKNAEDKEDHALIAIDGKSWPLMMRVNFNNTGLVTAIYIYRPDF
jgi:hypothetical protein